MNNNNKTFLIQEATPDQQIQKIPCTNFFPEFLSGGVVAVFVINLQHIVLHHLINLQPPIKPFPGIVFGVFCVLISKKCPNRLTKITARLPLLKAPNLQYFYNIFSIEPRIQSVLGASDLVGK